MTPSTRKRTWEEKLHRSGFFFGALLLHLTVFLLVATYVVFQPPAVEPDRKMITPPPPQPVVDIPKPPTDTASTEPPQSPKTSSNPNIIVNPSDLSFHVPPVDIGLSGIPQPGPAHLNSLVKVSPGPSLARLEKIHEFELRYRTQREIEEQDPSAKFPVYVASYADGDWYCNVQRDASGNIIAGSIPDLSEKIAEWSHGQIKAQVAPKPLNIGSSELLDTQPPFIFFTGHKDFVLTGKEIANLQAYVEEGGAIWGDNALAGKGSRFDVAFRREMKRVIPDHDKNFEELSMDTDIFTKQRFPISTLPEGMNYYSEPMEHLDIDGVPAIIYTPNDYSDLYAMRILPGDTDIVGDHPDRKSSSPLFSNGTFLHNESLFFRNFTLSSSLAVHRLGMNIVTYLIIRFDDKLLLGE